MNILDQIKSSVKLKIGFTVGVIVFFALSFTTAYFVFNIFQENMQNATNKIKIVAQSTASSVGKKIDQTTAMMNIHGEYLKLLRKTNGDNRLLVKNYLRTELDKNPLYHGVTVTFEPKKFDNYDADYRNKGGFYDDGRMNIYWYRENDEIIFWDEVWNFQQELDSGNGEWYSTAKELKSNTMFMDNYLISEEKQLYALMLTLTVPIMLDEAFLGVVCFDYQVSFMQEQALIAQKELFEGKANIFLVDPNGMFAASTLSDTMIYKSIDLYNKERIQNHHSHIQSGGDYLEHTKDSIFFSFPIQFQGYKENWHLMLSVPIKVIQSQANKDLMLYLFFGFIVIILSIAIMMFFVSRLIKPLKDLSKMAEEIADGNLDMDIKQVKQKDEIGKLALSFAKMSEKLKEMAKGMSSRAEQIAKRSIELSVGSANIAQGVYRQSSSIEQVSASMEQMLAAVLSNADRAKQTELIALETEHRIIVSRQVSDEAILAMKQIAQNVKIITEISKKTDILAINASIEAARAGNSGSGFAVVAAEIRKLAENTQNAAQKITQLADTSLKISVEAGTKLAEIVPKIAETTAFVREIALASTEQNLTAQEINNAIIELTNLSAGYSQAADNLDSNSKELSQQAKWLKQTIAFFKFKTNGL